MKSYSKKFISLSLVIAFVLLIAGCTKKEEPSAPNIFVPEPSLSPSPSPSPQIPTSLTTGRPVEEGKVYQPITMMIENSANARPQASLMQADIVYETVAEATITRFICLYNDEIPTYAGPCRSLRIYFLNIQREWDSILVHYGGPEELGYEFSIYGDNAAHIKARVNGVKGDDKYFTRIPERKAPHNAYTDLTVIQEQYGTYMPKERTSWVFNETSPYETAQSVTRIQIPYLSTKNPFVEFVYNTEDNVYYRYQEGKEFMTVTKIGDDSTTTQVNVKNLIVQYAEQYIFSEEPAMGILRNVILTGRGEAEFFIDGKHIKGYWERATLDDITTYYDNAGQPISFLPGNTWVAIQPNSETITVS